MGQRIGDYKNLLGQMQRAGTEGAAVGPNQQGQIGVRTALNPPSGWTKFKAWLSDVPLLGRLDSLRQARAEVDSYPVRLQQYQVESRQIMTGFMAGLRAEYGDRVATMATRNLDQTGAQPLTGRTVRTVLQSAEQAKKSTQLANGRNLYRFFESPIQGGTLRLPGEKDMVGVLMDRGERLPEGATSWKDMLGQGAANWVEAYVNKRMQEHPSYSTGQVSNEDIVRMTEDALTALDEFRAAGLPPEQLGELLQSAVDPQRGPAELVRYGREFVVRESTIQPSLDRKNPESMLRQTALHVSQQLNRPPLPDAVLKTISNNVSDQLCHRFAALPGHLHCGEDTASIRSALAPALQGKVETLVREHYQALDMIEASTVLSEPQKAQMRAIAAQRRIDPSQVRVYEQFATQLKNNVEQIRSGVGNMSLTGLQRTITALKTTFEDGLGAMRQHGDQNWESGSISGGELTTVLMGQMVGVGLADLTREEKQQLFAQMTSQNAQSMMAAYQQSSDLMTAAQIPLVYGILVDTIGTEAGVERAQLNVAMKGLGAEGPTLLDQMEAAGTEARKGNVNPNGPHHDLVRPDFSGDAFRAAHAATWTSEVQTLSVDGQTGLAAGFGKDLGRATFYVNGQPLSTTGSKDKQAATAAFLQAFTTEGVVNMPLALAVSRCMNQDGIKNQLVAMETEALAGGQIVQDGSKGQGPSAYEAWKDPDGSWNVRCTTRQNAGFFVPADGGEMVTLGGDGHVLVSITYRIPAASIAQGNPQIQVADSRIYFDF